MVIPMTTADSPAEALVEACVERRMKILLAAVALDGPISTVATSQGARWSNRSWSEMATHSFDSNELQEQKLSRYTISEL